MTIVYSGEGVKDTSGNLLVGVQNGAVSGAVVTGGRRNLIINGAMQVAQRGTSFAGATTAYHTDRWIDVMNLGSWTISQSSDAPDGFGYSHKWDCTTANGTLAAGSELILATRLEGQDCQQLKYGSANAESLTLSFWVKSSKTGTYTVEFDQYGDRQISRTYTIDSADTWEYKTVTVPGDTGGSIDNDNSAEFQLLFWLGAGSNLTSGTLNTSAWATTTNANRVSPSNVNLADNTANDWYITGVQLEVGSVATPFEHRSYGEELALCQRYYYRPGYEASSLLTYNIVYKDTGGGSSGWTSFQVPFPVTMRTIPTFSHNLSDSNQSGGSPGTTYWRFYEQNIGYPSKHGASNMSVLSASATTTHSSIGAYYVSPNGTASGIRIGSDLTFEFSAEI